jgi:glutathione peroxidase
LVVIGFPCNQFGGQEPGSEKEIVKFCSDNYKVTFPMMSKIEVNGDGQTALYKYLKSQDPGFDYLKEDKDRATKKEKISWNFEKFVVGKDGKVAGRISPRTSPDDADVLAVIDAELKK